MKNGSIVNIQNACKIGSLIGLQHKIQVLNTAPKLVIGNLQ